MKLLETKPCCWTLPTKSLPGMRVPGRVYANQEMVKTIQRDGSLRQIANAATLPGVVGASLAMPDVHFGYGLPIGGVLATDIKSGVVSPGGVGFDINCGVRLLALPVPAGKIGKKLEKLLNGLFSGIPVGVGSSGKLALTDKQLNSVLREGAAWAVRAGYGMERDLSFCESGGCLEGAVPEAVSIRARERGMNQLGTLGSGNHFIEIQRVKTVFDTRAAEKMGLEKDQVTVMIHSGSRGLGHQVCTDYLKVMNMAMNSYGISVPDRQLACTPYHSPPGQNYLAAMRAAANYAWANRQCMTHWVRQIVAEILSDKTLIQRSALIYDVAHNIIKIEEHEVSGKLKSLAVHRKGATRAFPPGHAELPDAYGDIGQPVLIPGDMGTASYIMTGTQVAMADTFGSACHGAGRKLSRKAAIKRASRRSIVDELKKKGVIVRARGKRTIAEEMPEAYKDISAVVDVVKKVGIANLAVELQPLAVLKG